MSSLTFDLHVKSDDPLATIEIASSNYLIVAHGNKDVTYSAPPGIYVARAKHKHSVEEQVVRVLDRSVTVRFESSATCEHAAPDREADNAFNRKVEDSRAGKGMRTWITIAIKGLDASRSSKLVPSGLMPSDFEICTIDGFPLHEFNAASIETPATDIALEKYPGTAASLDVAAGWYALSMPGPRGTRAMMPLYVSPRFSPTVFVESTVDDSGECIIDFCRLLVSYDANEFDSYSEPSRILAVDTARRSLELGRNTLTAPLMDVLLKQKFQDPALGLLALQLLLLEDGNRDFRLWDTFNEVSHNMAHAFESFNHPDLVLSRAHARRKKWEVPYADGDNEPLVAPPLLKANWNQLIRASNRRQEVLARRSRLYNVSQSLLRSGIWVVWGQTSHAVVGSISDPFSMDSLYAEVREPSKNYSLYGGARREYGSAVRPRSQRLTSDALFEKSVDLVRASSFLRDEMQRELASRTAQGSVLDLTVVRTVLQLSAFDPDIEKSVPDGYSSQLAKSLSVPLPILRESVQRVHKVLSEKFEPVIVSATMNLDAL